MRLTHRPVASRDRNACFAIASDRLSYDAEGESRLKEMWHCLLENGWGESAYIADSEASAGPPLAFGISAFITDRCCADLQARPAPWLSQQVLDRWHRGEQPFLDENQRRAGNSGDGLCLLILSRGAPLPGTNDHYHISRALMDGFYAAHRGYCLKEVLAECIGEQALVQFRRGGWEMRSDYRSYYESRLLPLLPPDRQPYLMGLTRAEAVAEPGRAIATLFDYTPPRFAFRPGEQALLSEALSGETDPELAERLGLSLWTVKKRWLAIYERVASVDPDLLPEAGDTQNEPKRGAEKRRHLLSYVREYREELRPIRHG
jgi:DNA-binding CsgD family transcriptional regulator